MPAPPVDHLRLGDHVCWTFDDDDERLAAMARLVSMGIHDSQKVLYLTGSMRPDAVLHNLDARGVPTGKALGDGQLTVRSADEVYLADGEFDPDSTLGALREQISLARDEGWKGLRLVKDMAWALRLEPGAESLTSYEAHANRLVIDGSAMAVCQYDRRLFPDAELRRVASAHPASALANAGPDWLPALRMRRTHDPLGLALTGEADISNRHAFAAVLGALLDEARDVGQPIVIDLSGLTFADSATAGLIVRAAQTAKAGVRLIGCSPVVSRLLGVLGAGHVAGLTIEARGTQEVRA